MKEKEFYVVANCIKDDVEVVMNVPLSQNLTHTEVFNGYSMKEVIRDTPNVLKEKYGYTNVVIMNCIELK